MFVPSLDFLAINLIINARAIAQARSLTSPSGICDKAALITPAPSTVSTETTHDIMYLINEQGMVHMAITSVPVLEKYLLQAVAIHIHIRKITGDNAVGGFMKRSAQNPRLRA